MYKEINGWKEVVDLPIITDWSLKELEEILQNAIFRCAVRCANDNHGHIFTTLSGGLDSSFCLVIIKSFLQKTPIHTFTIGTSWEYPDIQHAWLMAAKTKANHYVFIPTTEEIAKITGRFSTLFPDTLKFNGDLGVFALFDFIAKFDAKSIIIHDGIDELLGGYWPHREQTTMAGSFRSFWRRLGPEHLAPLERTVNHFGIRLLFPYLQKDVVEYISRIPLDERTSREESKIPLRRIAAKYLPLEIINRPKVGFCDALRNISE